MVMYAHVHVKHSERWKALQAVLAIFSFLLGAGHTILLPNAHSQNFQLQSYCELKWETHPQRVLYGTA